MSEGDSESYYAYYCLHKFRWKPSEFLDLDRYEKAAVIAFIDIRVEEEKKEAAKIKKGKRR